VNVRFAAVAEAELDDAVAHYDALRSGLGAELAKEASEAVARITAFPRAWQLIAPRARRCRLSQFPYALVYTETASELVVVAFMHVHRQPDYWKDRLRRPS
jgi:hypothetical protein